MTALVGDVLRLVDGVWRVVLAAGRVPVTDRRRPDPTDVVRAPTFGPGSRPYRSPTVRPNPHTTTWRPPS